MKDPAIRACVLNDGLQVDVEHLCGDFWLVLAQPGPAFRERGKVVKVRKRSGQLVAVEVLGKPH